MSKCYPPREFSNVPSHEESLDLWKEEADRQLPKFVRSMIPVSFYIGLVLLVISIHLASGTFKVTIEGQPVESAVMGAMFSLAAVLLLIPVACIGWVLAKLPPRPTREDHAKVLHMKRLLQQLDAQEAERAEPVSG